MSNHNKRFDKQIRKTYTCILLLSSSEHLITCSISPDILSNLFVWNYFMVLYKNNLTKLVSF